MRQSVFILLVTVLLVIVKENAAETTSTDKVFCYFESWTKWRSGNGQFTVGNINPALCTHITVAFIGLGGSGSITGLDSGPYADFIALKNKNPKVKLLVSMGGWNEGSPNYSNAVAFPATRQTLIQNIYNFVTTNKFDGFDLDWEYPAQRGGASADKVNYIIFLKELREKFGSVLLITAAVGATQNNIDYSYDVKNMNIYLDYINLMSYDLHGSYEGKTGQNAPLYASSVDTSYQLNQDACVKAWLKAGASPQKLFLGVGFYGRSYTLSDPSNNKLGAPASGAGTPGNYSGEGGMLTYLEICEQLKEGGWTTVFDDQQQTPYSYKGNQWVGYDNVQSLQAKTQYAIDMKLAGIMLWSVNGDDHNNVCGNGEYPLLNTINKALNLNPTEIITDPKVTTVPPVTKTTTAPAPKTTLPPSSVPSSGAECVQVGFLRDPVDCSIFYYCLENASRTGWNKDKFNCPAGLYYDLRGYCNYKNSVSGCQ